MQRTRTLVGMTINRVFRVFVIAFLAGGFVLTFGQLAGVVTGDGAILVALDDVLAVPTYVCAAIAGLLAFIEMYTSKPAEGSE